ncbi:hypothetical protein TSAR_007846 [Trichomalopsis sarcophagae]|uniref:C-type lectin domain-containing protein n=1 Tax=Trichomalopsis sarcophagae TaxID=543379 RepID=A0A232FNJ5_9HYME|nr:hypothetical protein TSAR_007846 [Trichomalopsis sarcophagae]
MNFAHVLIFLAQIYYSSSTPFNQKSESSCLSKLTKCKIPAGFRVTRGIGAYRYFNTPKDWNIARKSCMNFGAHLAVIKSKKEEDHLRRILKGKKVKDAWIGYHNHFAHNEWVSIMDEPLERIGYKNWGKKEPNNANGNQHCVKSTPLGWDDYSCSEAIPFFCKVDLNCQL